MTAPSIPVSLRQHVRERAGGKCEYCLLHQDVSIYSHEIDHIIALRHGGQTLADNLCLACLPCNRAKGSDLSSVDVISNEIVLLFHPRKKTWSDHFSLEGARVVGLTPSGRATVFLLKFNAPARLVNRQALLAEGHYP
jgi:hypothetical protein